MINISDFKEFLILLNKHKVKYLIVGGYAVSVYSYPVNTGDIDIWIEISKENAGKVIDVLVEFGFGNLNIKMSDLLKEDFIVQLGYSPNRIDILTGVTGLNFSKSYKNKMSREISGIGKIHFVSYNDLIINKDKSNREKDKEALRRLMNRGKSST